MRSLIVEDEFTSRRILQHILAEHGPCDVAVDGEEAQSAFERSLIDSEPYDLVCLDIMLPKSDGHAVLAAMRQMEEARGIDLGHGCKVIMTTSLRDPKTVVGAFKGGCESFLVKPIAKTGVVTELRKLGLLQH